MNNEIDTGADHLGADAGEPEEARRRSDPEIAAKVLAQSDDGPRRIAFVAPALVRVMDQRPRRWSGRRGEGLQCGGGEKRRDQLHRPSAICACRPLRITAGPFEPAPAFIVGSNVTFTRSRAIRHPGGARIVRRQARPNRRQRGPRCRSPATWIAVRPTRSGRHWFRRCASSAADARRPMTRPSSCCGVLTADRAFTAGVAWASDLARMFSKRVDRVRDRQGLWRHCAPGQHTRGIPPASPTLLL
jgi:hypothetical protein